MKTRKIINTLATDIMNNLHPNIYHEYGNDEQEPVLLGRLIDLITIAKIGHDKALLRLTKKAKQDYWNDNSNTELMKDLNVLANISKAFEA